ncbi:MAG: 4'-phosphopantetheinyl transferase superfamily protein [Kiritimatiellaeota bacterium]|nr:4'-phosphopantetheinyl transferase superfamily protein [Kiritimatiellota bacterium]
MNTTVTPLPGYTRENLPEHPSVGVALLHTSPAEIEALDAAEWFEARDLTEYATLKNRARRVEWFASRIALKHMLAEDGLIESPLHAHIRKNAKGAPHLVIYNPDTGHYAQLHCSLSHKGPLVGAAYSREPNLRIGIDIEKRSWRLARLRREFTHEADDMADKSDSTGGFTVLWAFKEAATKLLGVGMAYGFSKVSCRETGAGVCELRDAGANHYSGLYRWFGKYAVALVSDPPRPAPPPVTRIKRKHTLFQRLARARKLRRIR